MADYSGTNESTSLEAPDEVIEKVGIRLKLLREACGYSQRELARRAGLTNSSISIIEQGQVSPSVQSLGRILAALPITINDFFAFALPESGTASVTSPVGRQLDACIKELAPAQLTPFIVQPVDISGVVTKGDVLLITLEAECRLSVGSSFYIRAHQCYRFANSSLNPAALFLCSLFAPKP